MAKSRKPREESGTNPSRRVFLQRVAGAGLATAAGVALLPSLTEAGKGSTQVPTATGTTTGTATTGSTTTGTTTTTTTPTATTTPVAAAMGSDAGALNFLLTLERLEAAFYNLNINKAYLTATAPVGTTPTSTTGATTGATGATTGATGTTTGTTPTTTTPTSTTSTGTTTTPATGTTPAVGVPTTTPSGNLAVLHSLVTEISAHENSHVAQLEQILGTSAQAPQTFQNLDMPTLTQFLTLAEMLGDIVLSAYQGQIPQIQDKGILATVDGIQSIEGRHAGGIRTYRRLASTAEGGDPNTMLTEDGQAVNPSRTMAQVQTLIAPYIVAAATTPTTPTTTTPTTTTPTATTGTATGGTTGTNPATPLPSTGGTATGGAAGTTGTPSY